MGHRQKKYLAWWCAALWLGCGMGQAATVQRMAIVMGTVLNVEVQASSASAAEEAAETAIAETMQWDAWLSNYKDDSEIVKINRNGFPGGVKTNARVMDFLIQAKALCAQTHGAFDISIEPLTRLWHLRSRELDHFPTEAQIAAARAKVNYKNLELSSATCTARFLEEGMGLDTGGLGKGHALAQAFSQIQALPLDAVTLNFGGKILFWRKVPQAQNLDIKNPLEPGAIWKSFTLRPLNGALTVSTSGNYERYVRSKGQKLGHVINAKTGHPNSASFSVTAIDADALKADVYSTAYLASGLESFKAQKENAETPAMLFLYSDEKGNLQFLINAKWKEIILEE